MPKMILNSSRSVYIGSGVGRVESMRRLALKLGIRYLQVRIDLVASENQFFTVG